MTRYEAFIDKDWRDAGLTSLFVARIRDGGSRIDVGSFLVDLWCLGIKDAYFLEDLSAEEWTELVEERLPERIRETFHPACARKLVEGALAYAETLGFAPARDFRKARRVLGGIDESACPIEFKFGRDGRPCYVQGADDSPERVDRVMAMLEARVGAGAFDTILTEDQDDEVPESDAREWLMDFFSDESAGEDGLSFWSFSGLVTALHVSPGVVGPIQLMDKLWGSKPPVWEGDDALAEFVRNLMEYWNGIGEIFAERLVQEATKPLREIDWKYFDPIDIFAEDLDDPDDHFGALVLWSRGFLRAAEIWPEVWADAMARPDLAQHWTLLRSVADPGKPEHTENIVRFNRQYPDGGIREALSAAVTALHRELRPAPGERPAG
jgi:yecA family protein